MKLERIEVKNFGSFPDTVLDLTGVAAATVCGGNGAGKSTICVDAPLATLFGKCRVPLDDIMKLGTDDMALTMVFTLNGQRYRVIRKRSKKTKAGKSELSLQIAHGDGWEDASGSRIQDTQDKICKLLNMDYELLTSTGFLLQGQADRFSRATSSERKALLAQILRLDQYGPLKQAAVRHCTIADAKHGEKSGQLAGLDADASTIGSLEARQGQIATALIESNKAIEQLEQHQQEYTTKKATLAAEMEQLQAIPQQIAELQTKQSALLKDQATKTTRRERAAKILSNRTVIEGKVKDEEAVRLRQTHLESEAKDLQADLDRVTQNMEGVNTELLAGTRLKMAMEQADRRVTDLCAAYARETISLGDEITREESQTQLLMEVPCGADLQKVCKFTVNASRLKMALPDKKQRYANRWGTPDAIMEEVYPVELKALTEAQETYGAWVANEYEKSKESLEVRRRALLTTQKDVKQQLETLKLALTELAKFTVLVPELAAAEREVESVDQDLAKIAEELTAIDSQRERLQIRLDDRTKLTAQHDALEASRRQDSLYLQRLRTDSQTAIGRLKELELEIKRAQDAGRQAEQLRQECASLLVDGRQFQALATAYAQIPVLILESSIPLLEEEANRILGKISSSGLRVTFETQKALKSRDGLAETLDIKVRDVFGERMLENYSGGERARVDLAIRIGLSRLLANRAGARLETLVVDEAFAAVDREGVEQLVECLPMLSQEFPLILFITHDDSFKSAIAQQILVTKGPSGSQVAVVA